MNIGVHLIQRYIMDFVNLWNICEEIRDVFDKILENIARTFIMVFDKLPIIMQPYFSPRYAVLSNFYIWYEFFRIIGAFMPFS